MSYAHNEIDQKWQEAWAKADAFRAHEDANKPKYYALDMFPYPSGAGLHVGHVASYTPTDVLSRFKRAKGFSVLHPIGYDAFGLPAEQYAIQTGIHPAETTRKAIDNFRRQLKSLGCSFDWSREISTCEPDYYHWTQFIFLKLLERGLAYQKEVAVNWCPALRTVLANEEVVDGKSERGGHPVVRKPMKQWILKITDYAERLLTGLDALDWPERTKEGQRNWIGKSEGARVRFPVDGHAGLDVEIFTTRPDTIYGVSFMVLAPEHPLVQQITSAQAKPAVDAYVFATGKKSEVDRKAATEKTGVPTGAYALNPLMSVDDPRARVPIWIADYVLADYGTGAVMAVPAHDERDAEFAETYGLPIREVIREGRAVDSGPLDGLESAVALRRAIEEIERLKIGQGEVQYRLRDWLFSRQRYWGEPFPVVYMNDGAVRGLRPDELPVTLPPVADYEPTAEGEPPLARVSEFVRYRDPKTGEEGRREVDTMPGSAASSWYFLRYTDPKNAKEAFAFDKQKYWMPVDLYVGGPEHTVGHLLYARFWQKVLFDCGLVSHDEPFKKLAHQGVIGGPDGQRMSKSRGNVVNPDDVREQYGADALRMYLCFLGPFEKDKAWTPSGIEGVKRFLDRLWRLVVDPAGETLPFDDTELPEALNRTLQKTIKKVGEDVEAMSLNTAISAMMILLNETTAAGVRSRRVLLPLTQVLAPFAPHVTEELWSRLGQTGFVSLAPWPSFDPSLVADDVITMGVQVLGKTRGSIEIAADADEETAMTAARAVNAVNNALVGKTITKIIYKPGKILNIIVK